jgi:hypothetical protein
MPKVKPKPCGVGHSTKQTYWTRTRPCPICPTLGGHFSQRKNIFGNVRFISISNLILSVVSCIVSTIRKLGKAPKLERLEMTNTVKIQELWNITPEDTKEDYAKLDLLIAKGSYKKVGK